LLEKEQCAFFKTTQLIAKKSFVTNNTAAASTYSTLMFVMIIIFIEAPYNTANLQSSLLEKPRKKLYFM
jgi:hypothetical protein